MKKLYKYFILALPSTLFFSNFPLIKLGETDTMHLEISLPEVWLVLFAILSLKNLKKLVNFYGGLKLLAVLSLFPLYAALSLFWTTNFLRGFLTVGLLWLVFFAALNLIYLLKSQKNYCSPREISLSVLIPALLVSAFCWLQCILDLAGLPRESSLLCLGCVSTTFGFPHPNGFAIEPQFMGNLLLAPTLLSFYLLTLAKTRKSRTALLLVASLLSATLFLTFSRGAIYAFIISAFLLAALLFRKTRRSLLPFPIIIVSFIFTLCAQGIFAELSPTSDTFTTGTTKSIHHLTLGLVDLRSPTSTPTSATEPENHSSENTNTTQQPDSQSDPAHVTTTATFSGYVPESTNVRLSFTNYAFDVWNDSPATLFFGTGLGSAGSVIYKKHPEISSPKEIVQNEYASLLLELGLIAYLLLALTLWFFRKKLAPGIFITCLLTSYAITLCFFSGLPNALHIYLLPGMLYFIQKHA